jgi:hypothetical protein
MSVISRLWGVFAGFFVAMPSSLPCVEARCIGRDPKARAGFRIDMLETLLVRSRMRDPRVKNMSYINLIAIQSAERVGLYPAFQPIGE